MSSHICKIKTKKPTTITKKKNPKLIDTENRLVVARGERWGVGKIHEEG